MIQLFQRIVFEECQCDFYFVGLCAVSMKDWFSFRLNSLRLAPSHEGRKTSRYVIPALKFLPFGSMSRARNSDGFHAIVNMNRGDSVIDYSLFSTFPPWSSQTGL
jgi:hypothetical protein